jgi:hypothetical protein
MCHVNTLLREMTNSQKISNYDGEMVLKNKQEFLQLTYLDECVKKFFCIISYTILDKVCYEKMSGIKRSAQHVMKAATYIGHGIKENTELAEHEAGVDNVKKCASSVFKKMRNVI